MSFTRRCLFGLLLAALSAGGCRKDAPPEPAAAQPRSDPSPAASLSGVYQVGYFFFSATVTAVAMFCLFSVL